MIALINIYECFEGGDPEGIPDDFKFLNVGSVFSTPQFLQKRHKFEARNNKAIYAVSDNFIITWSAIQKNFLFSPQKFSPAAVACM